MNGRSPSPSRRGRASGPQWTPFPPKRWSHGIGARTKDSLQSAREVLKAWCPEAALGEFM